MRSSISRCLSALVLCVFTVLLPNLVCAQRPAPGGARGSTTSSPLEGGDPTIEIDIYVRGADGAPIEVMATVTLVASTGQIAGQGTTLGGNIKFSGLNASQYSIQVEAPGYQNATQEFDGYNGGSTRITIDMRSSSDGTGTGMTSSQIVLAPKAQKELAKALEALRAKKNEEARHHLEAAYRLVPNHPAVNYLYGVYCFQINDQDKARSYWTKALEYDAKHLPSLLSMSEALLRERKLPDAESYVKKAVDVDPSSWRAHAILADVLVKEHVPAEAIKEAERALELGHGQAGKVQIVLVQALAENGDKQRAIQLLRQYVKDHPDEAGARKQLENLEAPETLAVKETKVSDSGTTQNDETILPTLPIGLPASDAEGRDIPGATNLSRIPPKAQQALDKAVKQLGPNMLVTTAKVARAYLDTAYKIAPTNADVNYFFGVYSWQTDDRAGAISYWRKAVEFYPEHYRALISLGQALVDENKPSEALPYLERATKAEPYSWRPYVLAAHIYLRQGLPDQAAKQAERALALGRDEAAIAQRYLAAALAKLGENGKAAGILQSYVKNHRANVGARKQLEELQAFAGRNAREAADSSSEELLQSDAITSVTPLPLPPSRWLPPDIDDSAPTVDTETACALTDVLQKTASRVQEFVKNVDRYTASEFLNHESIDQWGYAGPPETRKYDYVAAIEEFLPGRFSVTEYRGGLHALAEFPDGVATNGLPALALIFHAKNAANFEMSCEGLGRWNGTRAWLVHFRQRPDKPNTIREYKLGVDGPSYPVSLKGRAWIAVDNYQIVHMETDLIAPVREIRLFADHTVVEYGPVRFRNRNVEMWLPLTAEVYYDWRGKRIHRRHSFSNYLLYAVDEKQHIADPKVETEGFPQN